MTLLSPGGSRRCSARPPRSKRKGDPALGGRDAAISLRWSGDPREEACALAVCAALARAFDAVIYDADKDRLASAEDLLKKAKSVAEDL